MMMTYFQYMKVGAANPGISDPDSNFVRSWRRYFRPSQRKGSVLHVETKEFHDLTRAVAYRTIKRHDISIQHLYIRLATCLCLYVGAVRRYLIAKCCRMCKYVTRQSSRRSHRMEN